MKMQIYNSFPKGHDFTNVGKMDLTVKIFRTELFAIVLEKRGVNDDHLCMRFLSNDDDFWCGHVMSASTYFLEDFIALFNSVRGWLVLNAEHDTDEAGNKCGWKMTKEEIIIPDIESKRK